MKVLYNQEPLRGEVQPGNETLHDQLQNPRCETSGRLFPVPNSINTISLVLLFYGYFVNSQRHLYLKCNSSCGYTEDIASTTAAPRKTESAELQTK